MAKSINRTTLLGNTGKDPEIKTLQSGQLIATFSVATEESYKDRSGNKQTITEWHNVTAFGRLAEIVRDYVHKGSKVHIEAKLSTRSWDDKDSGKKRYKTEIVIQDLILLGDPSGKKQSSETSNSYRREDSGYGQYANQPPQTDITDDDIPF